MSLPSSSAWIEPSWQPIKAHPSGTALARLTLVASPTDADVATRGARDGETLANATQLARDLANAPPGYMTATGIAELAAALGPERGLDVQVFDEDALAELGCRGLLGVNRGSAEPARMVKLTYVPRTAAGMPAEPSGRLTLVGKGVMYDSEGSASSPPTRSTPP